jgi:hypothetical protein
MGGLPAIFAEMIARARRVDGCPDVAIRADSVDPDRISVFELWRDQQSLDVWRRIVNARSSSSRRPRKGSIGPSEPRRRSSSASTAATISPSGVTHVTFARAGI